MYLIHLKISVNNHFGHFKQVKKPQMHNYRAILGERSYVNWQEHDNNIKITWYKLNYFLENQYTLHGGVNGSQSHSRRPRALPVAAIPVVALPVAALPVAAIPVVALPVAALPVVAIPVVALPVAALPVVPNKLREGLLFHSR